MDDHVLLPDISNLSERGRDGHGIETLPVKISHTTTLIADEMMVLLVAYLKPGMTLHGFNTLDKPKMLKSG